MILFVLGIITGLLLSIITITTLLYFRSNVERKVKQVESKLKIKGSIIEENNEELELWINELPNK